MNGVLALVPQMAAQWQRQEVLANNLANASTPGFKRDDIAVTAAMGGDLTGAAARALVQWTDYSQGSVRTTGRPLDVALNGSGFFVVDTPEGPRYTRGGSLTIARDGSLVTGEGNAVLSDRGPIIVGSDRITITPTGEVATATGAVVGTLRVVDFARPYQLQKAGNGLYTPADPTVAPRPATGFEVAAGSLESSNVNVVEMMVNMIDVLRTYESAQKAIQSLDEQARQANDMGRV